jgi:hypothetical protein
MKMRLVSRSFVALGLVLILASCQKEASFQDDANPGNPSNPGGGTPVTPAEMKGDWLFIGQTASTRAAVSFTEAGLAIESITTSDYTTTENVGSIKITDTEFQFTGLGLRATGIAYSKTYVNGSLLDETSQPFDAVSPPTDKNLAYTKNSADSITFANGYNPAPDPGGLPASGFEGPMGAKISISNDTMTLKIRSAFINTIEQGGVPAKVDVLVNGIIKLKRK